MEKVKFKKARTLQDIKDHPLMDSIGIWTEEDDQYPRGFSYWGCVKSGWQVYDNEQHTIHEETIKEFCDVLNNATPWADDDELDENQK